MTRYQQKLLTLYIWVFYKADLNTLCAAPLAHLFIEGDVKVRSHSNLIAEVLAQGCLKDHFMVIGILFGGSIVLCLSI